MDRKLLRELTWLLRPGASCNVWTWGGEPLFRVTSADLWACTNSAEGRKGHFDEFGIEVDCSLEAESLCHNPIRELEMSALKLLLSRLADWDYPTTHSPMRPFIAAFILPKMATIQTLKLSNSCIPAVYLPQLILEEMSKLQSCGKQIATLAPHPH